MSHVESTVDYYLAALTSHDSDKRRAAAEWFADHGDMRAFHALARMARDPLEVDQVRHFAIQALGRTGSPLAFSVLQDLLRTPIDASSRSEAARALGALGDSRSLPLLIEVLVNDTNPDVQADAAAGLGNSNKPEAVPVLLDVLQGSGGDAYVRICAIAALGQLGQERSAGVLSAILLNPMDREHGEYEREQAARALGLIGGELAKTSLSKAAESEKNEVVRSAVFKALQRIEA